jgi:hypothetical protein
MLATDELQHLSVKIDDAITLSWISSGWLEVEVSPVLGGHANSEIIVQCVANHG